MQKWLLFFLLLGPVSLCAQPTNASARTKIRSWMDSLHAELAVEKADTVRIGLLLRLVRGSFQSGYADSQLLFSGRLLALAQKSNNQRIAMTQGLAREFIVRAYQESGRYPEALQAAFAFLQWAEETKDSSNVMEALRQIMFTYSDMKEYETMLTYGRRQQRLVHSGYFKKPEEVKFYAYYNAVMMGTVFEGLNQMDSALHYRRWAYRAAPDLRPQAVREHHQRMAVATMGLGKHFFKMAKYDSAWVYYRKCIESVQRAGFRFDLEAGAQLGLARIYRRRNQPDSAIYYAGIALHTLHQMARLAEETEAASLLHELYADDPRKDSAYKYLLLATRLKDSLFNQDKIKQTENIKYREALRVQRVEQERKEAQQRFNTRLTTYGIAGGLLLLLSIVFFLYRLNRIKHETRLKAVFNRKIHQVEMRALRAQMNPHFIFNCLNSINRYIVKSDHITASNYLTRFARLIRLILDNSESDTITLDKEIQTLQLYVEMEILRFDNAFQYTIETDESILPETITIPSMLLQPYVENAIWHGLLHKDTGDGKLWIRFRESAGQRLTAEVEDNGIGRQAAKEMRSKEVLKKKSYGMQISKDRIFLINELYNINANVQIDDLKDANGNAAGTRVTVELPMHTL